MNKIYAILVAYNPSLDDINASILRLLAQTDKVILCNNSDFDLSFDDERVVVFNFRENLGIAKAQSIGMKWAFENGADFILQMDQDSVPHDNLVNELKKCYDDLSGLGYNIGLVGSQDYDKDTLLYSQAMINKGSKMAYSQYLLVSDILSSGSLIPKLAYSTVGGMDDDLFIDIVDFEYCWRLKKFGFLVIKNTKALLAHKLGSGKMKIFGIFSINIGSPFRHYYQFRNILYMMQRDYVPFGWKITQSIKMFFKLVFLPIGADNGSHRLKFMTMGILDFIKNKKGRI